KVSQADVMFTFITGIDGLRFLQQLGQYVPNRPPTLNPYGTLTMGSNLTQAGDAAVGLITNTYYTTATDNPENKALIKAWTDKYPNRLLTVDVGQAYGCAQAILQVLKSVNGNVEDKQGLLNAFYGLNAETAKGPIKLDADHDVVQNTYISEIVKSGSSYADKLLTTYNDVARTWDMTQPEIDAFPFGQMKGKWVGMTKDKLATLKK
ncbi:MAG TPA: ABC transporter substrate-binding protein, partial [Chloroflexota bacterium]|nr:ABC transporter substrate-binding protein [Chloroflexota bacterium]